MTNHAGGKRPLTKAKQSLPTLTPEPWRPSFEGRGRRAPKKTKANPREQLFAEARNGFLGFLVVPFPPLFQRFSDLRCQCLIVSDFMGGGGGGPTPQQKSDCNAFFSSDFPGAEERRRRSSAEIARPAQKKSHHEAPPQILSIIGIQTLAHEPPPTLKNKPGGIVRLEV